MTVRDWKAASGELTQTDVEVELTKLIDDAKKAGIPPEKIADVLEQGAKEIRAQ